MGFFDDIKKEVNKRTGGKTRGPDDVFRSIGNDFNILLGGGKKKDAIPPGAGNPSAFFSDIRKFRKDVSGASITKRTRDELLTQLGTINQRKDAPLDKRNVEALRGLQSTFSQITAGDSTKLGRRENLRFRLEIAQDRPGRGGLIFGR